MAKSAQATATKASATPIYQLVPVNGPSAGVDLRLSPTLLPATRARTLINWSLTEPGALVVRPGWRQFASSNLGASRVQGAARVALNTAIPAAASTIFTVVAWNQTIREISDGGVWGPVNLSGLSTNEVYFPADRDLVAAFDGSTGIIQKSTNGSSWTPFGVARPVSSAVLSTLSTGGLSSGEYEINFTYKDRNLAVESNGSSQASTRTLAASSGAINVVIPNSTASNVQAFIIYARSVTNGESLRRKVSSQAQSAGANSTFVLTSTNWTTNDPEPTDHGVPTSLSFGVVWKNRWWARDALVTNRLRFSQVFQAQSWPETFYVDIPFERGDAITALIPLGDALIVFGSTKPFLIVGQTSLDFEVRPTLAGQDGALGPRAVCALENGIVHAGAYGVWVFDGTSDRLLSYDLEPGWRDLVTQADPGALARVACVYHLRQKELRVAVPRLYPTNAPGEWVLDMNQSRDGQTAWTGTDRDISGYVHWDGPELAAGNRGRLLSWPSTGGLINEEGVGTSANSSNLTATYEGPGLTLGAYRARWIDLRGEYEPNAGTFFEEAFIDGVPQGSRTLAIGAGLSKYGTAVYGTATYSGAGRRQFYIPHPLSAAGRTLVQRLTYVGQQAFRVFGYQEGIVPEPKSRNFSE